MTNKLNIEETLDIIPRNSISKRKWNMKSQALRQPQGAPSEYIESSQESQKPQEVNKVQTPYTMRKPMQPAFSISSQHKYSEESPDLPPDGAL